MSSSLLFFLFSLNFLIIFAQEEDLPEAKVQGGRFTRKLEFPHLGILVYKNNTENVIFDCAATLISDSFALTAAHCVTGKILEKYEKLTDIWFGDNDLSVLSCKNNACPRSIKKFAICKSIPHENFTDEDRSRHHDIALLQLCEKVKDSLSIKPINMPWTIEKNFIDSCNKFNVIGWGRTLQSKRSFISQKVEIPRYNQEDCKTRYARLRVNIVESQICAGGEFKKDACDGDSGGPLEAEILGNQFLVGIVSFSRGCGLENWPGIYTNVLAYQDWITSNMIVEN